MKDKPLPKSRGLLVAGVVLFLIGPVLSLYLVLTTGSSGSWYPALDVDPWFDLISNYFVVSYLVMLPISVFFIFSNIFRRIHAIDKLLKGLKK